MGLVQGRNSLELFYLKCSVFRYSNRQISSPPAETTRKRIFPVRMVEKIVMFCTYLLVELVLKFRLMAFAIL